MILPLLKNMLSIYLTPKACCICQILVAIICIRAFLKQNPIVHSPTK